MKISFIKSTYTYVISHRYFYPLKILFLAQVLLAQDNQDSFITEAQVEFVYVDWLMLVYQT